MPSLVSCPFRVLFNPLISLIRKVPLAPFYMWDNWGIILLCHLCKVTRLTCGLNGLSAGTSLSQFVFCFLFCFCFVFVFVTLTGGDESKDYWYLVLLPTIAFSPSVSTQWKDKYSSGTTVQMLWTCGAPERVLRNHWSGNPPWPWRSQPQDVGILPLPHLPTASVWAKFWLNINSGFSQLGKSASFFFLVLSQLSSPVVSRMPWRFGFSSAQWPLLSHLTSWSFCLLYLTSCWKLEAAALSLVVS